MNAVQQDRTGLWSDLETAARRQLTIVDLFEQDDRASEFSVQALDMLFDYSKTSIDAASRAKLLALVDACRVTDRRDQMFAGAKINRTEDRAVLHTALRNPDRQGVQVDGHDVMPGVHGTLGRMAEFARGIREGSITGQGGAYTDVVNIGIGGSDLGPAMAVLALTPYHDGPRVHFVSNVDGAHLTDTLAGLDPTRTLVIVASKSFATIETMTNARSARDWMAAQVADPARQFAAVSTASNKTSEFGIACERTFGFDDWVGGRYSVWGPVGLSVMLAVGPEDFRAFLDGGHAMDQHFRTATPQDNLPMMLALVGLWHHQFCGLPTRAVLPYEERLLRLPAYLQQLEMESNGKRVTMEGAALAGASGPVVWGEPGTNGQHAFYQLIHQGTTPVPCEFMVGAQGHEPGLAHHHALLLANCFAQSEALMLGRDMDTARALMEKAGFSGAALEMQAAHRVFPGNRPSTTLIYPLLTPHVLGQIVALYEHRVFVEGVILGINSFDQWGVELGKELATDLLPLVKGADAAAKDPSTRQLLAFAQAQNPALTR